MESGKHTPPANPMGRTVIPSGQQLGVSVEVLQGRCTLPKGREGDSPGGKGRIPIKVLQSRDTPSKWNMRVSKGQGRKEGSS